VGCGRGSGGSRRMSGARGPKNARCADTGVSGSLHCGWGSDAGALDARKRGVRPSNRAFSGFFVRRSSCVVRRLWGARCVRCRSLILLSLRRIIQALATHRKRDASRKVSRGGSLRWRDAYRVARSKSVADRDSVAASDSRIEGCQGFSGGTFG
jgi:hypothetical protein